MKTHVDRNDYDESHKIIKSSGRFLQSHYDHLSGGCDLIIIGQHIEYQVAQSQCSIFTLMIGSACVFVFVSVCVCWGIRLAEKSKINEIGFSGQVNQYT